MTGGGVALHPEYTFLPLSMDKAALRAMVYAMSPVLQEKGIYIGLVTICGGSELLRLIEVGASCFNHYCTGCDFS